MIHIKALQKKFQNTVAVSSIDLQLEEGQTIALLGPNGAGKTTTFRMLAGLIKPTSGSIQFDQVAPSMDHRHYIGYLPQYPQFHGWMTGFEFLILMGELSGMSKAEAKERAELLLTRTGLDEAKHKRISGYSGGMKQRLGIAQAMIHQPKLLILDEPVSSLDPVGRRDVLNLLKTLKNETTILFSTHILSDAEEISDYLVVMNKGRVVEQGHVHDLEKKYQKQVIKLAVGEQPDHFIQTLETLPYVKQTRQEGQHIYLETTDMDATRASLLSLIIDKHLELTHFSIDKTTLEEMFLEVIGFEASSDHD
ncbi:putative ABC transporter ATP-binding protein YxlF [Halolactibacillus miurensis]|uniref:ABC transporter ATP-binding protein YxlF n=1 Tax=Halolactibacillus miurensis TaxID=306541 RepID=A0A1I6T7X7_9BACI|nr:MULTISPECIES: ABC transporter ATP-binding protein [Halolactibacillus]GEM04357.1 putative ABC transporter ATP-binding protein YxlF [Halolactibacillus miurensis]SFS85332.1 ABC-2 type transport system ATP-binding protein [Halolactibacillus miurensis]